MVTCLAVAFLTTFGDFADILAIVVATMLRRVARRSTWRHDGNTNM